MAVPTCFVGIDVAKATLDVAVRPAGKAWSTSNNDAGVAALVARLRPLAPALIVLEATGGFETAAVAAVAAAGLMVVVANPRQVRDFAKATGPLAKTAVLDAQVLALFAERVRPEPEAHFVRHTASLGGAGAQVSPSRNPDHHAASR